MKVPKGQRAIDKFVDAVREVEALRQAVRDDGKDRTSSISFAIARKIEAERMLSGGQLGRARLILAGVAKPLADAAVKLLD